MMSPAQTKEGRASSPTRPPIVHPGSLAGKLGFPNHTQARLKWNFPPVNELGSTGLSEGNGAANTLM